MLPLFDAHLDLAWNAIYFDRDLTDPLAAINAREQALGDSAARGSAAVCFEEMHRGQAWMCLATIMARANPQALVPPGPRRIDVDYGRQEVAYAMGQAQLAYYRLLEQRGVLRQIHSSEQLDEYWTSACSGTCEDLPLGFILAMECADPIVDVDQLCQWQRDGLRCISLAHYGPGHYSCGTGGKGGLTDRGKELLVEMQRLDIVLDLVHSTARSYQESLEGFDGPVLVSHANAAGLVPGQRQLSDRQFRQLVQRGGIAGVACDAWMLRPDWIVGSSTPQGMRLDAVADHVDYFCQLAGSADHVAVGSDLDGGFGAEQRPENLSSIADLQRLAGVLRQRGYSEQSVRQIFFQNWLDFFRRHLPSNNPGGASRQRGGNLPISEMVE